MQGKQLSTQGIQRKDFFQTGVSAYKKIGVQIFLLIFLFVLAQFLAKSLLVTEDLERSFYSDLLGQGQIDAFLTKQKDKEWLAYVFMPLILILKVVVITSILDVGLLLKNKKIRFGSLLELVIKSEFIFLLVPLLKILWLSFFVESFTLKDYYFFYPLSALQLVGDSIEEWLIYPFQLLNLIEVAYWFLLSFFIGRKLKSNMEVGFQIVAVSYIPALFLWVLASMFLVLTYF